MSTRHSHVKNELQMSSKHVNNITNGFYLQSALEIMYEMEKNGQTIKTKQRTKVDTIFLNDVNKQFSPKSHKNRSNSSIPRLACTL